jgi:hypothetical protein
MTFCFLSVFVCCKFVAYTRVDIETAAAPFVRAAATARAGRKESRPLSGTSAQCQMLTIISIYSSSVTVTIKAVAVGVTVRDDPGVTAIVSTQPLGSAE